MIKKLTYLSMDFYDDLRFLFGGKKLQCNAWIDKVFSDYYVLDYCEAGSFLHAVGDEELVEFTGPVAWLTYAGPRYRFGWPQKDRSWVHRCVAFSGVRADRYLAHGLFPADVQRIPIKVEDPTFFSHRMDEILLISNLSGAPMLERFNVWKAYSSSYNGLIPRACLSCLKRSQGSKKR